MIQREFTNKFAIQNYKDETSFSKISNEMVSKSLNSGTQIKDQIKSSKVENKNLDYLKFVEEALPLFDFFLNNEYFQQFSLDTIEHQDKNSSLINTHSNLQYLFKFKEQNPFIIHSQNSNESIDVKVNKIKMESFGTLLSTYITTNSFIQNYLTTLFNNNNNSSILSFIRASMDAEFDTTQTYPPKHSLLNWFNHIFYTSRRLFFLDNY